MAGRSQASNLTGMLSGIGDTIGEMGGPGRQYVDTFRRSMAPKPDMSSAPSLEEYAQWARRNGYDEEADKYMALAYKQKEVEKQEAKDKALGSAMADASKSGSVAMREGARGDLGNVDATISVLNSKLEDPAVQANPQAVQAITSQIQRLENNRPAFEAANTEAIARGVVNIDRQIASLDKTDPDYEQKKAGLESARARFMDQPDVEETYQLKKLELMEIENKQSAAMWTQQSPAIVAELKAAGTDPSKIAAVEAKYPQYAGQIAAVSPEILAQNERLAKIRADDFRVENLPNEIDAQRKRIGESNLTDQQKADLNSSLDTAESLVKSGQVYKPAAIESYAKVVTRIDQMINQELAAEAGVERQRTERAVVEAEKAAVAARKGPKLADVIDLVEAKTGDKWEDIDADEQRRLAKEAERELMGPLLDYWERANIAAGLEPYKEFDAEDVQTVKAEIREQAKKDKEAGIPVEPYEVSIQRKAYGLAAEGYNKDAVIGLLSKETTLSLAQAEEYYEQIMADIEVNDARIAALVEESIQTGGGAGSVAGKVYAEAARTRSRGNRTVDPNAVSDDHATRTRALLSDPDNRWQGITLTPQRNKLAEAYAEQSAGRGFRYPSMSELQPISSSNRRR
jgi:hypothetical protein